MINTVVLMGRLTFTPELQSTPSGISLTRFQIAVDRNYSKQGEEKKADFIDVMAWRQTAEFVTRYFQKGSMIAVEGSIQTDNFTDKNGNKRKSVTVVANQVSFCGSRNDSGTVAQNPAYTAAQPSYTSAKENDFDEILDDDDDELPFM